MTEPTNSLKNALNRIIIFIFGECKKVRHTCVYSNLLGPLLSIYFLSYQGVTISCKVLSKPKCVLIMVSKMKVLFL